MKINQFEPYIGEEEYIAIKGCFDDNWITEGKRSESFSKKLLDLTGAKYGVFAQNGTLALYLALRAIDIKPGDEVIVPNFTFIASANAVEMVGATPIFVDVDIESLQIDIEECKKVLTGNTKAIMPVHIYGMSVDMSKVLEFAKTNNLRVVEDAAQGIGVTWDGKHTGTFGDVGCFSFFADKTITTGEGGYVVTNNEEIYKKLLYLRNQGRLNRGSFIHPEIGYNFRITDIQAAIGLVQISKLSDIIEKKKNLLNEYKNQLSNISGIKIIEPPAESLSNHIPFRVVLICEQPVENLMKYFTDKDIETRTVFYPLHRQPCYGLGLSDEDFKNSIYAYEHGICLPSYPTLSFDKVAYICDTIKEYYGSKRH
tara:strand:+ start:5860 stop:6966 length:1107 start_codon:yes stop_codon:yes gene_type:complete